jgi:HAD superfamily hydrolase (TIGR01549 family)
MGTQSKTKEEELRLPAFLFDLDGTLIDSVYEHVEAWSKALRGAGLVIPNWKIHRRIGMGGKSFVQELMREEGHGRMSARQIQVLEQRHDDEFSRKITALEVLPGSRELLNHLSSQRIRWAIATTGNLRHTRRLLGRLKIPDNIPVVTGDDVAKAKPAPDVFFLAAQKLGTSMRESVVVGDSTWDLLAAVRKSALGVGLLSGGYSQDELERAGAFRVYADPADMLAHIEHLGIPGR